MNIHEIKPDIDEARWHAQERARLAVRDGGIETNDEDMRVAMALRRAPEVDLPADFALHVAHLARAQLASTSLLEQRLLRGLALVFGLSSAATVAYYGHAWVAALATTLPGGSEALGWSAAAAVCMGGNWAWGLLRERMQGGHDVTA